MAHNQPGIGGMSANKAPSFTKCDKFVKKSAVCIVNLGISKAWTLGELRELCFLFVGFMVSI
jgi:hypothetical protein